MAICPTAIAQAVSSCQVADVSWEKFDKVLMGIASHHFKGSADIRKLLTKYSEAEREAIFADFEAIRTSTFASAQKERTFVLTAGGPGSGKSTHLETVLGFSRDESVNHLVTDTNKYAYIDPDRRALFFMENTFKKSCNSGKDATEAYTHWREASQFIAETLLALALNEGYAIAFGTTMTAPPQIIEKLMTTIKGSYGYSVEMHHISASDDVRVASIKAREENGIIQSTTDDVRSKGGAFFERLPAYVKNMDTIIFMYRSDLTTIEQAARYEKGHLTVINEGALAQIRMLHDEKNGEGTWNKTVGIDR